MRAVLGHFVDRIMRRVARDGGRTSPRQMSAPAAQSQRDEFSVARELSQALDRAMQRCQWQQAARIAATAMRIACEHPMLCERIARMQLALGQAESALNLIETCASRTSSLRLLHVACLLQLGRRHEAHLALREFTLKSCAPVQARLMLGLLEWHGGDTRAAHEALTRNNHQIKDPHTLLALALINVVNGNLEQATRWIHKLQQSSAWSIDAPLFQDILHSMGLPLDIEPSEPAINQIEALAVELLANEQVIPALVYWQQSNCDFNLATMLARAIEQALPDLEDRATGYLALCDLHDAMDDAGCAAAWLHRGAAACPMSVALARRIQELDSAPNEAEMERNGAEGIAA